MPQEELIGFYLLTEDGILLVGQRIACLACGRRGEAFLNMSIIVEDKIKGEVCPGCKEESLVVTTFKEEE